MPRVAPGWVSRPLTIFPRELYRAPRSWAEAAYPELMYFNEVEEGNHFAAWQEPELFTSGGARRVPDSAVSAAGIPETPRNDEIPLWGGISRKRLKGFEPSTFCMASRRSSQLSYSRICEGTKIPAFEVRASFDHPLGRSGTRIRPRSSRLPPAPKVI
jgi:hypothetical protein